MNMLHGRLDADDPTRFVTSDGVVLPVSGRHAAARGRDLVYGVRPEAISLGGPIAIKVVVIEPTGFESQVLGELGKTAVTCVFRERVTLKPGEVLNVSIDRKPCIFSTRAPASGSDASRDRRRRPRGTTGVETSK